MWLMNRFFPSKGEVIVPEAKTSLSGSAISRVYLGQPIWTPDNYEIFIRESYYCCAVAYRCVKLIAGSAASVPWLLTDGKKEVPEDHPLYELLDRPNPSVGGHQLMEAYYAYLMLAGNSYLEQNIVRGEVRELWNLRPDRMKIIAGPQGLPQGYQY